MTTIWDQIKSVSTTKEYNFDQASYNSWVVNRSLASFKECLYPVSEVNLHQNLTPQMQYDYYFYFLRSAKRYKPWIKKLEDMPDQRAIGLVSDKLKCNLQQATQYWKLLTEDQKHLFLGKYEDRNAKNP